MAPLPRLAAPAACLFAGLAQAASLAAPWNGQPQWWLQLLSLAVLAHLVQRETSAWRAAAAGWLFATAWLCGTFWWLYISMHVYGGLPAVMAAAAVLLLAGFLALYYALACGLYRRLARGTAAAAALLFASLWLLAELLRATLWTGFPWGASGYAHVDGPLSVLARVVGVHGLCFAAAWTAFGLSLLAQRGPLRSWRYWGSVAAALGLLAACNMAAVPAPPQGPRLSVALLQGNIPQDEKFEEGTGVPLALAWYSEQLRGAKASLVVAPETAIPLLPTQLPEGYMGALEQHFRQGRQAALIGLPLGSYREGYSNSAIGLRPGAASVYRYDKHHLVPFGEFVPPFFRWFTRMMNIPLGDFNRGSVAQPSFAWQGELLAPNICYEDLFGEELGARFRDMAAVPTIFVNLSNIAWFGDTIAIDQHLQISRMRALEFERPMLRATNTGATVVIDRHGRVTHALQRHTRGVLQGEVEGGRGFTPYAQWVSRWGLWPLWILSLGMPLLFAAWRARAAAPRGRG
jgi:apolipoprotein N-acyltransferase